jgi:hypothetical protein
MFCCTSTEKVIQPLGFCPLANAEESERERQANLQPEVATKKSIQGCFYLAEGSGWVRERELDRRIAA